MSSITGLISGGGGGGTPVNSVARHWADNEILYTDPDGSIWLKTGNVIAADASTYPDATISASISNVSYNSLFNVGGQESSPWGVTFNNDGTKMYVIGSTGDDINQYTLSTAWEVSTATFDSVTFSVSGQDSFPTGVKFNSDGTKMYVLGNSSDSIYQYSLSTAFAINTASYDSVSLNISGQDNTPFGFTFNSSGTKMYACGNQNDSVYQYSLSTAFDLSTASYDSVSFSVVSQDYYPRGLEFNSDGTKMYVLGSINLKVYQYSLSTAYDISTASYSGDSLDISGLDTSPAGIAIGADETRLYVVGNTSDIIYQLNGLLGEAMGLGVDTGDYDYVKLK